MLFSTFLFDGEGRNAVSLRTFFMVLILITSGPRLFAAQIDYVTIGDGGSQADHNFSGSNLSSGTSNGAPWIGATNGGWFSFDFTVDPLVQQDLIVKYWGSDAGSRSFTIFVDGIKIAVQSLNNNNPGNFFEVVYQIPLSLTRHRENATIRFEADVNNTAGDIYGIRIETRPEPGEQWPVLTHDPSSIVKCKETYWIFGTGEGVQALYSTNLVTWKTGPSPFARWNIPTWIHDYAPSFDGHYWAPECIYMNDLYYLYYSASEWGTKNSAIGVAVNKTLDPDDPNYEWTDLGKVVSSAWNSDYNAIDPAVVRDPVTKKIWFVYGSFNYAGIKVAELDSISGKIKDISTEKSVANHWIENDSYAGEAAMMVYHNGYFYLFMDFGGCCQGINSSYYIVMGRSTSPQGPFVDKTGRNMFQYKQLAGGSVLFRHDDSKGLEDRYYGPGHPGYFVENGIEYLTFHYYDPNFPYPSPPYQGGPMLGMGKLTWGEDNWPLLSIDWIERGRYKITNAQSELFWTSENRGDRNELWQAAALMASEQDEQQWDFIPLGRGEYKIASAADTTLVVTAVKSTSSDNYGMELKKYTGSVDQKFRIAKYLTGELMVYQTHGLQNIEIPWAVNTKIQLGLWWFFNGAPHQKWIPEWVSEIPEPAIPVVTAIQSELEDIELFPNPVTDNLNFYNLRGWTTIELLDIHGNSILQHSTSAAESSINIMTLKSGLYLVRINYGGQVYTTKVFKQ
jgi:arabinan endo-1,5-alpha-L-arabinosidase